MNGTGQVPLDAGSMEEEHPLRVNPSSPPLNHSGDTTTTSGQTTPPPNQHAANEQIEMKALGDGVVPDLEFPELGLMDAALESVGCTPEDVEAFVDEYRENCEVGRLHYVSSGIMINHKLPHSESPRLRQASPV